MHLEISVRDETKRTRLKSQRVRRVTEYWWEHWVVSEVYHGQLFLTLSHTLTHTQTDTYILIQVCLHATHMQNKQCRLQTTIKITLFKWKKKYKNQRPCNITLLLQLFSPSLSFLQSAKTCLSWFSQWFQNQERFKREK